MLIQVQKHYDLASLEMNDTVDAKAEGSHGGGHGNVKHEVFSTLNNVAFLSSPWIRYLRRMNSRLLLVLLFRRLYLSVNICCYE